MSGTIASPPLHSLPARKIPRLSLRKVLLNPHLHSGNLPALFADLAKQNGPVFELRPPFKAVLHLPRWPRSEPMGPKVWTLILRSKEYLASVESAYGASRTIHTMDGADHFHLRKALQPSHSPETFLRRLDEVYRMARQHLSSWDVGDTFQAGPRFRRYLNAQMSPLLVGHDTTDVAEDILAFHKLLLIAHLTGLLPKLLLKMPGMRRRAKLMSQMAERIKTSHTPAQRAGQPPDVIDGYLAVHANEEHFLPETDLSFPRDPLSLTGMYLADLTSFTIYHLASNPDVYRRVQSEADALFADGDPTGEDLKPGNIDVTARVLMEVHWLTPNVGLSVRTVMNPCIVEGYELPLRARVIIAQAAPITWRTPSRTLSRST